jgi:putative ABC transport system permease protein
MPQPASPEHPATASIGPGPGHASLIRRALRSRPLHGSVVTVGLAISSLLVLVLLAAFRSPIQGVRGYVARPGLDLWVSPLGTDNLIRTAGFLPLHMVDDLREIPGVRAADPLLRVFVRATQWRRNAHGHERNVMLLAMGYRVPAGLAGPPAIAMGRAPEGEIDVALDRAAAFRLGLGLGDTLRVNDRLVRLAGITRGTNLLATQFLFFDLALGESASGLEDQASFFVVRTADGEQAAVARRIKDLFPGVAVFSSDEFARNSVRESAAGFVPLLALIALLGVLASAVTVTLLVQNLVEERQSDLAVLMAMGASVRGIGTALVAHASMLVVAGSLLGALLACALAWFLDRFLPTIHLTLLPLDLAVTVAVFSAAGAVGAISPLWRLRRIDPLEAFRA